MLQRTNIDRDDVLAAMRGIDMFKGVPAGVIKTERLGGLTNRNFRIDSPLGRHVLRIPGAGTSEYINRHNEAHAAKSAAKVGVNADVVHFDEATGVMLCRYVDGGVTLNADRFRDLGSVKRSAARGCSSTCTVRWHITRSCSRSRSASTIRSLCSLLLR